MGWVLTPKSSICQYMALGYIEISHKLFPGDQNLLRVSIFKVVSEKFKPKNFGARHSLQIQGWGGRGNIGEKKNFFFGRRREGAGLL